MLCFRARLFIDAMWSPAGKRLTSPLSFVMSNCLFVTFPYGIRSQVWDMIVSIPDISPCSYFKPFCVVHVRFHLHCFFLILDQIPHFILFYFHFKGTHKAIQIQ